METKLKSCLYCGTMFDSKWNQSRKHWAEYCPECTKQHVWWKKSNPYRVSDEGVVIYENS